MKKNKIFEEVKANIAKGGEISPFLFLWNNLELLHADIENFIWELFHEYGIDLQSLFHLVDTGESIKIEEVKRFISQGDVKPRFAFQIFFIEHISRMTLASYNACLKFFEEPGVGNIIFLTNSSEAGILDTILSRVQTFNLWDSSQALSGDSSQAFYMHMIESHIQGSSDELVRYFFSQKYEKQEYVSFLNALMSYLMSHTSFLHLVDELYEDIGGILQNNLQARYVTDKYIMLLKN